MEFITIELNKVLDNSDVFHIIIYRIYNRMYDNMKQNYVPGDSDLFWLHFGYLFGYIIIFSHHRIYYNYSSYI